MSEKPTHSSVTAAPCTCSYLENAANDPSSPIIFNGRSGEYQFTYYEGNSKSAAMLVIYHCPFCGGAAPKSKRHLLFEVIPQQEKERLAELLKPIETIEDAIRTLGTPDFDSFSNSLTVEHDVQPPVTSFHRLLQYYGMSDTVDVHVSERPDGKVHWELHGKLRDRTGRGD